MSTKTEPCEGIVEARYFEQAQKGVKKRAHCPGCNPEAQRLAGELEIALRESVKLQAHYAALLNQWDGGKRMIFPSSAEWIARLKETGTIEKARELKEALGGLK